MDNYYIDSFGKPIPMLTDLSGNPIERTPYSHPYNFDQHVTWVSEKFDKNKILRYNKYITKFYTIQEKKQIFFILLQLINFFKK